MRARSASWASPDAPGDLPSGPTRERARTPSRGRKQPGPVGQGFTDKRSVAVIGYLPDLAPLVRDSEAGAAGPDDAKAYGKPSQSSPLLPADQPGRGAMASPMTPLMNAFRGGKEGVAKWFREGSVRGSVFNLCSATLGRAGRTICIQQGRMGPRARHAHRGALATTYSSTH